MLYHDFSQFMTNHIQSSQARCILALSGGVDSRVLLHLLARYMRDNQCPAMAVHVHHGLSASADRWVECCRQWCAEEEIPFQVEYIQLNMQGKGVEAAARQARYQALQRYINKGDLLLTGQHRDDQLETFLLALKRGSGPKGLSGMAASMSFHQGWLLRPLLHRSRAEIEAYANTHQLSWVEDESNQDTRFDRNFIRHEVMPLLVDRWPHFPQAVQRSAELCASQEALLNELLQERYQAALQPDNRLSIRCLLDCGEAVRAQILRMWLEQLGHQMPSRVQLENISHQVLQAKADANPRCRIGNDEVRRFDGYLYCIPVYADISDWQCQIKINHLVELPDGLGTLTLTESALLTESVLLTEGTTEKQVAFGLDKRCLSMPLRVTFNPEGLVASPVGRRGRHKLKKLFQEYRIPSWQRRRVPILISGQQVIAVAGLFVDEHFSGSDYELIWGTAT
ncbi:tRNA lysidine(34) synthetase TilS [Vibrio sp. MEBiC08052]|uniref:tRNA lysidine(34) synthetase TilS n=1 Tax=Vibrio sp. MEBiC08052 TaxID=1761910 RepID=UPI0007407409|nr:tRNA lysidine(34) synthetase TilS [Vibrio sp. MEBiC08052]KUI98441.1 tRNA(Ile)-lysidine synthase [Vibrio sp. MEBiC08052]